MDLFPKSTFAAALAFGLAAVGCGPRRPAQCGVASLVNVLGGRSVAVRYADLLPQVAVRDGHTTFEELRRAASRNGVRMRGYLLDSPSSLAPDDVGVVELSADHFVALLGREGDAFRIVDSPDGEAHAPVAWSSARLEAEWTGHVLLVERAPYAGKR